MTEYLYILWHIVYLLVSLQISQYRNRPHRELQMKHALFLAQTHFDVGSDQVLGMGDCILPPVIIIMYIKYCKQTFC
jgi:hypothetical protein